MKSETLAPNVLFYTICFHLVALYHSVAVTQLEDISVITTLLGFPVHKPKLHQDAIYH